MNAKERPSKAVELRFLLELLSSQDWEKLPVGIDPVWVQSGTNDFCSDKPLLIIAALLEDIIVRAISEVSSKLDVQTLALLWEIQAICLVVGEYRDSSIFQLPLEPMTAGEALWRAIGRLCSLALADPNLQEIPKDLNFQYFVDTYLTPATDEDLKQFPVL